MEIYDLKVNYQKEPLGICLSGLTFSWKVRNARGKRQAAAVVTVSEDADFKRIVHESGEDAGSCAYTPDLELAPGRTYFWRVKVTDELGDTAVSAPSSFEGGHPREEWHGVWIQPPFVKELHPVFEKEFCLEQREWEELAGARLYICGLGLYEAYINGEKAGDDFLAPYFTDYRYWLQYQTYDVQSLLRPGVNRIRVFLGNGWYKGRFGYMSGGQLREYYGDRFCLLADLYLFGQDGSARVIATDDTWTAEQSPVLSSGIYDGEVYDARKEPAAERKEPAKHAGLPEAPPRGALRPMLGVRVKKKETFPVREILTTPKGETVLDFGQEITGWVVFRADVPEGVRITLQHGEVLQDGCFYRDNLRTAQAEYTFISKGEPQLARPHFTFFGFRYVKVTGMRVDETNRDGFEAWSLYSDMEETGFIRTSHSGINRLISNTKWSQKDNFLDIPTDCPQRDERLGWTGDAQIFSGTAAFYMQTGAFFRKYLKDMAFEQEEKGGAVPYVVPDVLTLGRQMNAEPEYDMSKDQWGEAGSCVWGDAATIIPWNLYLHYGNKRWLEEQYGNMRRWTDFIIRMDEQYCGGKRLWTCGFHFGDWLSLDCEGDSLEGGTDKYFVASAFYLYSAELTAKAARILEREEAAYYEKVKEQVRRAIREKYMRADGHLTIQTQTAYALGICLKLFEEDELQAAGERLCGFLDQFGGHLATGFVGTAYLCPALVKTGHSDRAYGLLLNEEYPGWLYEVGLGATTVWERWNSLLPDGSVSGTGMNSLNHYAYGVIAEWIYRSVCGLNPSEEGPGCKRMVFEPYPDRRLSHAWAEYRSMAGDWLGGWEWKGDRLLLRLTVPFDCQARLRLDGRFRIIGLRRNGGPIADCSFETWDAGEYEVEAGYREPAY